MGAPLRDIIVDLPLMEADRQRKGLSLVQIAIDGQVDVTAVSNVFNGRRRTLSVIHGIARALGYPAERYLLLARKLKGPRRRPGPKA